MLMGGGGADDAEGADTDAERRVKAYSRWLRELWQDLFEVPALALVHQV